MSDLFLDAVNDIARTTLLLAAADTSEQKVQAVAVIDELLAVAATVYTQQKRATLSALKEASSALRAFADFQQATIARSEAACARYDNRIARANEINQAKALGYEEGEITAGLRNRIAAYLNNHKS